MLAGRSIGPDELFLLNSTSGTTGLPKCVMHTQNRWIAYHRMAVRAGDFGDDEVFMSLLPAPFGFGLWTAHVTPTMLGCPDGGDGALRCRRRPRPHRAGAGHGAVLREHPVHHVAERPGRAAP